MNTKNLIIAAVVAVVLGAVAVSVFTGTGKAPEVGYTGGGKN